MVETSHVTTAELEAGLDEVRRSPKDGGPLELIVRRPQTGDRHLLEEGELDLMEGLMGVVAQAAANKHAGPHHGARFAR